MNISVTLRRLSCETWAALAEVQLELADHKLTLKGFKVIKDQKKPGEHWVALPQFSWRSKAGKPQSTDSIKLSSDLRSAISDAILKEFKKQ